MIACIFLVLLLCLFTADVGFFLVARQEAQDAADAASLSAVQQSFPLFSTGIDPERAAARMASMNGARLTSIRIGPGGSRAEIEVEVTPRSLLAGRLGLVPRKAHAKAAAEVDIEELASSGLLWSSGTANLISLPNALVSELLKATGQASTLVVLLALGNLGKPYAWGATGPNSFDCSGLVCYVFAQLGVRLPRTTYSQVRVGRSISPSMLAPGDLVFFRGNAHVGIYIGGGCFVHAPHTGDVVRVSPLAGRTISACRRVI
jgi:cell wall-associated NlpC family hydrolase